MDERTFWKLIEESKAESKGDSFRQLEILQSKLERLSPTEIVEYDRIYGCCYRETYRWDLRAAAYLINEGCSDDWFDYFRSSLITQGEQVFRNALADPNSLADVVAFENGELSQDSDWAAGVEEMDYVASQAYENLTGEPLPDDEFVDSVGINPLGNRWEGDEAASVLPRLAAHCLKGLAGADGDTSEDDDE